MSTQIQHAGSWYGTMREAADQWAETALPDVSVVGREEAAEDVADTLEVYWWNEAQRAGLGAPEDVDAEEWREACRAALVRRIEASR